MPAQFEFLHDVVSCCSSGSVNILRRFSLVKTLAGTSLEVGLRVHVQAYTGVSM
jgi:hypothetical protein